ncbi:MAG: (Fe-S)-binding protein [Candidatus Methylomirabilales bacterium]
MIPSREIYWNIPAHLWLYPLFLPFLVAFLYGCYRLVKLLWVGQPEKDIPPIGRQIQEILSEAVLQRRLLTQPLAGGMHAAISWGFGILFVATCMVALQDYFGIPTLSGDFYLYFMSLTVDVFGVAAVVGVILALVRRYVARPERLWKPRNAEGYSLFLWLLLVVLVTGFVVEGLRIVATTDPWGPWSPGGWVTALGFSGLAHSQQTLLHRVTWWGHAVLAFAFIALAPYTLIRHILAAAANVALRRPQPSGVIQPVVLEEAEHFGISTVQGFPRKDLLDLVACTECGRCQDVCPAWATGKPLTPKGVIIDLRDRLLAQARGGGNGKPMVGGVIGEDVIWSCTTCGACHRECPVFIEPIPKIINMRRFLVMEEARFPETMQAAMRGMETRGHPYQGAVPSRTDWAGGLDIPLMAEKGTAEYLYWVGCAAAFDERTQKVARALVKLLKTAGVDFAILGEEERCTGDPARRIGHEFLFQMQAQRNIQTLDGYGVKKIITACPHCFNTLGNEYGQFGGHYDVIHHTVLIRDLMRQDRLQPKTPVEQTVAYHDSCYLGRHNGILEAPREILQILPGVQPREMERNREKGFCCGAGGGMMWFEERIGKRVNIERTEEALRVKPDVVGTACPFCLSMFEDGIRAKDATEQLQAMDLAELVARAL